MKKIQNVIIIITVVIAFAVGGIIFIQLSQQSRLEDSFSGEKTDVSADDILLAGEKEKAPEATQYLFLSEKDMTFDIDDEVTSKSLDSLDSDFFGGIILKSGLSEGETTQEEKERLLAFSSALKERKFKVYIEADISMGENEIADLCKNADGVLLCGSDKLKTEKLNSALLKIKAAIVLVSPKAESYIKLPLDYDFTKLNKKSVSGIYLTLSSPEDAEDFARWDKSMKIASVKLIAGFTFKKDTVCDLPLKSYYAIKGCESISGRAFSGYSAISKNKDNAFGALKQYITEGVIPELALRSVAVSGYGGEVQETEEFEKEIEVYGSNLFPCYMDGKKLDLGEKGSRKVTLSYGQGENTFTFVQGSESVEYKLCFNFTGELIRSVSPSGELSVLPKESVTVLIVAFSQAEVTVKVGTTAFEAKPFDNGTVGYTVFTAKIKMPDSKAEIESLGMITVIATYGESSEQMKGAMIKAGETPETTASSDEEETTTFPFIGNYSPSLPEDAYTQSQTVTTAPSATATTQYVTTPAFTPYTGSQMCIVTAAYADTRPLIDGDDTFVPYYAPLVAGTVDYVTAESEAWNSEDEEQVYFYELASGRKVKREDVVLVSQSDPGQNSMSVLSSTGDGNGTLKVTFSTNWKIPYDINYTPQEYYSGYRKKYNVSSFTATQIQITFYHTATVSGSVDVSGSNVVSSAQWASYGGNAVLTLTLRQQGEYYGCSIEYDSSGNLVLTVHNRPGSLAGAVILLDPGHGGKEPGAVGFSGSVKEKDVNYAIAYYTKLALEKKGATVYLTRGGDDTLSLEERKVIARSLKPDLFIAIHNNGSEYPERIGTSTYYYKPFSQPLAKNIYDCLLATYKNNIYAGRSDLFSEIADGVIYYPFSVTRIEDCPSVLLEVGYMTNDSECYELIQTENQILFGNAIAEGVERTLAS